MAAIEIRGLSKRFGDVVAVDDLSFTAREGAVTGFLGPNGAGKTTTLRALLGLILGVLAVGLTTAIVLITLSSRDIDTGLTSQEITEVVIGLVLATALWAALGVGLGALVRNQVGAIVGALGWTLLVENLLTIIPTVGDWVQKYGLNGVTNALSNIESEVTGDVLSQAAGGALLLAYTAAFVIAGTLAMRRRDITS